MSYSSQLTPKTDILRPEPDISATSTDQQNSSHSTVTGFNHETVNLTRTASTNSSAVIPMGGKFQFDSVPVRNQLALNWSDTYRDRLEYHSNFSSIWNNGSGSLPMSFNEDIGKTRVSITNAVYNNFYTVNHPISLSNGLYLNISLSSIDFTLNSSQYGHFSMMFAFDKIKTTLVFSASPSYTQYVSNSSDEIVIITNSTGNTIVDITALADQVGGQVPTELDTIYTTTYVNAPYNLSATFDHIMLMEPQSSDYKKYTLDAGQVHEVDLSPDILTTLSWYRNYTEQITHKLDISQSNLSLVGTIHSTHNDGILNYTYSYNLSSLFNTFTATISPSIQSSPTQFTYRWTSGINWTVTGELVQKQDKVNTSTPIQGKYLDVDLSNVTWSSLYLYHRQMDEFMLQSDTSVSLISVPSYWSQGDLIGYVITPSGNYISWQDQLLLSPSRLASNSTFQFSVATRQVLPVKIQNQTSGQIVEPSRIISTINGSIWQIDDRYGIIIAAGAFEPGTTTLRINATSPGMVPVVTTITLIIGPVAVNPDLSATRLAANTTLLSFKLLELNNWTVGASIHISGPNVTTTHRLAGPYNEYQIIHPSWNASQQYELVLLLVIDQGLAEFNYTVPVGAFDGESMVIADEPKGNQTPLILSFIVFTGISGTLVYQTFRSKYSDDTISF